MPKFTQLTMPTLDDPTALQKLDAALWLTQEVLDTTWVRLRANPNEVVEYALEEGDDWVINTRWGTTHRTTYSSLPDLLMLHIDSDIVRVLKLKANNEVDLFKEFNPLWLWGLFSPLRWVFTAPTCGGSLRVLLIQAVEDGFTIHPLAGAVFNPLKVKRFTHLANQLTLNVPDPVLEIFSAKGQFPYLISNDFED